MLLPARRNASADTSYGPVSVCLSVTSRSSIETAERIELVFGKIVSSDLFYTVLLLHRPLVQFLSKTKGKLISWMDYWSEPTVVSGTSQNNLC